MQCARETDEFGLRHGEAVAGKPYDLFAVSYAGAAVIVVVGCKFAPQIVVMDLGGRQ